MRTVRAYLTAQWNTDLIDVSVLVSDGSLFDGTPDHATLARTGPGQIEISVAWEDATLSIWLLPRTRGLLEAGLALTTHVGGLRALSTRHPLERQLRELESNLRLRVETERRRRIRSAGRLSPHHASMATRLRRSSRA